MSLPGNIITFLEYLYLGIISLMTIQAIFSIRLRLYIWEEPEEEDEPTSITLFRFPTFNVHAFTSRSRIKTQQDAKASGFLEKIGWTSAEKQRLIDADTHLLPQIEITAASQRREIALPAWLEGMVVALFLGATLAMQALSLFNYPAYTSVEGNYMANAWAVLQGELTPYTFTYDHPPLGWIQIAVWTDLTGGITSFGSAINSGRILMLVLATASSLSLYLIASRLSGSRSAALLAMVIYTLSPLSLLYRHEVLLDNIGTFWLLLSLPDHAWKEQTSYHSAGSGGARNSDSEQRGLSALLAGYAVCRVVAHNTLPAQVLAGRFPVYRSSAYLDLRFVCSPERRIIASRHSFRRDSSMPKPA